ncbi:MAG TPA: DUF488 domain-containing protein [Burkholderiales bacterium]|nr:DUF488 domain-containing protein [Burkholderiales bacterium]
MNQPRSTGSGSVIYTIGHGNRAIGEFVGLLREAGIECVMDVRAYPASRRHPQFARQALERSLAEAGIRYVWEGKALGGRRRLAEGSPHVALKSPGFRAFADHMASEEFRDGLGRLVALAKEAPIAILCAERLPWQCHRFLISDSLLVRGAAVEHIVERGVTRPHALSAAARREGDRLIYDAGEQLELGF